VGEPAIFKNIASFERVVNNKWARVHIANWVNEAHNTASATQVQTWQ
jgi:hypothetical protein